MPRTRSTAQAAQQDARSRVIDDPDLVDIIFKQLDFQSLARVAQCSKAWRAQDKEAAWSALLLQHNNDNEDDSYSGEVPDEVDFVIKVQVKDNRAPDPDHGDLDGGVFFTVDFLIVPDGGRALSTQETLQFLCEKIDAPSIW